jgi:hypothetical protein
MVKEMGFAALLWVMAAIAAVKALIVLLLPNERTSTVTQAPAHAR